MVKAVVQIYNFLFFVFKRSLNIFFLLFCLAPLSTVPKASNIIGNNNNNTAATNTSPFGSTMFTGSTPSGGVFNQPVSAASATSINPWGSPASTGFGPFGTTPNQPVSTASATLANPWGSPASAGFQPLGGIFNQPVSTAPAMQTNTNTSTSSVFPPQPVANTNIFTQAGIAKSLVDPALTGSINWFNIPTPSTSATTVAPAFPINPIFSTPSTTNITSAPATSTVNAFPFANNFPIQPTISTPASWSFPSSATSILNTIVPSTTTASNVNPVWNTTLPATQSQPVVTSSSIIQQQFLAASLLDPYASRGRKDFTSIDQIQILTEAAAVSTLSTTTTTNTTSITTPTPIIASTSIATTTTPVITSAPIPITIPIQSNVRKSSSARSFVDVNFKLKPVSSSPTLNDDIKPSNQQSIVPTVPVKSTLAGNFTDEEEHVLLSRTKLSKLRLSDVVVDTSYQSDSIRSLYPVRRLAELENFTNITPPSSLSSSPTSTGHNERISRSSSKSI